jgi:phenylalanyl-tRNA synthetase beta chain
LVTIQADFYDLQHLVGRTLPTDIEDLNKILAFVKCEVSSSWKIGEEMILENKDSNRPDLWSVEGIARALRGYLGVETRAVKYVVAKDPNLVIRVDKRLQNIRPFIGCFLARNVQLNDQIIRGLINLQEKLDVSYGRRRSRASIGFYDFDLMQPPLSYEAVKGEDISFTPLGFTEEMNLVQILKTHPKGIEYGHIVKLSPYWPILRDSAGSVLSFPPIINSNDLGQVTEHTRNILVEVTGTRLDTVSNTLTILAAALADRGGKITVSRVTYPYGSERISEIPSMKPRLFRFDVDFTKRLLGLQLTLASVVRLLGRARYGVKKRTRKLLDIYVPCYRIDVMHQVDIAEDIAIAYGLENIEPRWPRHATIGGLSVAEEVSDLLREILIGLAFQEVLTFTMTTPEKLFTKMRLKPAKVIEVANPKVLTFTCLRNWLLPSLLEFLSHNTHVEYPQRIFEVGLCFVHDPGQPNYVKEVRKLACASIHALASYTEIRSYAQAIFQTLGFPFEVSELNHPSFIEGRAVQLSVEGRAIGFMGEVHPEVLNLWGLGNPAVALELEADEIINIISSRA